MCLPEALDDGRQYFDAHDFAGRHAHCALDAFALARRGPPQCRSRAAHLLGIGTQGECRFGGQETRSRTGEQCKAEGLLQH